LRLVSALLLAWGELGSHEALAQAGQGLSPAPPEVQEDAPVGTPRAGSLSERLDRSNGVIAPPASIADTDPGIVKPAPSTGATAMPVIPPPGTPGGDPKVQPK